MLEIKNVCKTFYPNTVNEKKLYDGLSLTVNDGDFITIIGSNGSGKSSLFNVIFGNYIVDSGQILLDGIDITYVSEHIRARDIGILFQDTKKGTAPNLTILENLYLAYGKSGWLSSIKKDEKEKLANEIKKLDMGLENRLNDYVGLLSGGQRQALTLLMATINPPKLLLLDEHTAALDPSTAEKVLSITKQVIENNKLTCLMVTHNMEQAIKLGNRILMMDNGKIIFDISGEEKKSLTVDKLLGLFKEKQKSKLFSDEMLMI